MISRLSFAWDVEVFLNSSRKHERGPEAEQGFSTNWPIYKAGARTRDVFCFAIPSDSQLTSKTALCLCPKLGSPTSLPTFDQIRLHLISASSWFDTFRATHTLSFDSGSGIKSSLLRLCSGAYSSFWAAFAIQWRVLRVQVLEPYLFWVA
jgi:hypothetical protein